MSQGAWIWICATLEEPQSSQQAEATAAPSSGEAGPGLMPEPLPQDVPIPDGDDSEADQPTIAA